MSGEVKFESLWQQLGLDSLLPDKATTLNETHRPDWDASTIQRATPGDLVDTEPRDFAPQLSITPPRIDDEASADPSRDLTVLGVLGQGGMGRVLLAWQASLKREVAVKVPRKPSPGAVGALVHEARTTGALEHPGVIPIYALASDKDGHPALVMKRVDGVSWFQLLHDPEDPAWSRVTTLSRSRIEAHVEILMQVCHAIAYAHKHGVLHRDLKPANILIGEFGEVYVADWGVAAKKDTQARQETKSLVGTPAYLAPEMVTGDAAQVDERSDVYLLGATLYEVLTGQPPHLRDTLQAALRASWEGDVPAIPSSAPPELSAICLTALAREKGDRYPSVQAFREALTGFMRHRGSVRLASAANERLNLLLASLSDSTTQREAVYPMLAECRFGFSQALKEWPENDEARRGLERCLEATARYEVSLGNLPAVKALVRELKAVPPDLLKAIEVLEAESLRKHSREQQLTRLEQELDPTVALRERVLVFALIALGTAVSVVGTRVSPDLKALVYSLGSFRLLGLLVPLALTYFLAIFLARRSLLGTHFNRRLTGFLVTAFLSVIAHRFVNALADTPPGVTIAGDLVILAALCGIGSVVFHWQFLFAGATCLVGAVLATLFPEWHTPIFGATSVLGLVILALSWRSWKFELGVKPRG